MSNIEVIERLYKEGSITFKEALELGLGKTESAETSCVDAVEVPTAESYIEELIDKTIYGDEDLDIPGINIGECADFMRQKNWSLYNTSSCKMENPVSDDVVLENAKYVCKNAVEKIIERYKQYKNGWSQSSELEYSVMTGAFKAAAYIYDEDLDKDEPILNLDLEFIPSSGCGCIEINKLIEN